MQYQSHTAHPHRPIILQLTFTGALALAAFCLYGTAAAQDTHFKLESPAFAEGQSANQISYGQVISADGRFIAFTSRASNLVAFDTGPGTNVFIRDLQTGTTKLVSVNSNGTGGSGFADSPAISRDGRYVAFVDSIDVAFGKSPHVLLRDMQTETTTIMSVDSNESLLSDGRASSPAISPDGQFVTFYTTELHMFATPRLYVRDRVGGTTTPIGIPGTTITGGSAISADGRFIFFGAGRQLYARDLQAGTTALVSVNSNGTASSSSNVTAFSLSADGHIVAFENLFTTDLAPLPPKTGTGIYVRNLTTGVTLQLPRPELEFPLLYDETRNPTNVAVSADGRYVVFIYYYVVLDPIASPLSGQLQHTNIARYDLATGTFSLLPDTGICNGNVPLCDVGGYLGSISADGRYVSFNLSKTGSQRRDAAYVGDFLRLTTTSITNQSFTSQGISGKALNPITSTDGRFVAFSTLNNLLPQDTNTFTDVYKFDLDSPDPGTQNGIIQFGSATFRAQEGGGSVTVPVLRGAFGATGPATVDYATGDVTAHAGTDYVATSGTLTFGPGEDVKFINVPLLDDAVYEGVETLSLNLSNPTGGYTVGGTNPTTTVFVRDSTKPGLMINDVTATEGEQVVFTATLSFATAQPVVVDFGTADGTAKHEGDYLSDGGTLIFNPGETTKTISIRTFKNELNEPEESFFVNLSDPIDAVIVKGQGVGTIRDDPTPYVQFVPAPQPHTSIVVPEESGSVTFTVERASGDPSIPFSVSYETHDLSASERSDYEAALGTLDFAPGEMSKTITVLLSDDAFEETGETFTLTLSAPTNGAIILGDSTIFISLTSLDSTPPTVNPIDDPGYFVTQQYKDFLNRLPDQPGLAFWTKQLRALSARCDALADGGQRHRCVLDARAQISAAFFLSIEFQQTGYFVARLYAESFHRIPTLRELLADTRNISRGVIVGAPGWEQQLEANKQKFVDEWVRRPDFHANFDTLTNKNYVTSLFLFGGENAGAEPELQQRLVAGLDGTPPTETRATVLRKVADSQTVFNRLYNLTFVLMQYYGYLRRNPNDAPEPGLDFAGFHFWLDKLNEFSLPDEDMRDPNTALSRIRRGQMIEAFIDSGEYRGRFGP